MPITVHTTPQQQAEIEAHWANVRAGLHVSPTHDFADDAPKLIEMHRAIAMTCIRGAALHARKAIELAGDVL